MWCTLLFSLHCQAKTSPTFTKYIASNSNSQLKSSSQPSHRTSQSPASSPASSPLSKNGELSLSSVQPFLTILSLSVADSFDYN